MRAALDAIRRQEAMVTAAGGVALRYGGFTARDRDGAGRRAVGGLHARKFPLVGDGGGVWSFIHIEDAAAATMAALEHWTPGEVYNVVDDEPAPVREWLPAIAAAIGAPPPRKVPRWVARLMGEHLVAMMCEVRGASNAKARRELGWTPRWPTWREGFAALGATRAPARAA